MRRAWLLSLALIWPNSLNSGQYLYWVDFSSPLHHADQVPASGLSPRTPSSVVYGAPTVVSSFGHLTNQPLLFKGTYYEQIKFDLGRDARRYFIEFDFETRNLNPSLFLYAVLFDTPFSQLFCLHGRGYIGVPPANSPYLPGWTDNEPHHMRIDVNLDDSSWTLRVDNRPASNGPFEGASADVFSIRLNLSPWIAGTSGNTNVQVAIDNIRIGTPRPAPRPMLHCPETLNQECVAGAITTIPVSVVDSSTTPLEVVWKVDGVSCQTNTLPPGAALTPTNLLLSADFGIGNHTVSVSARNGEVTGAPVFCSTVVSVQDTVPPNIAHITATPSVLWPPNGQMVPVRITVDAEDSCGPTECRIVGIDSNEPLGAQGHQVTEVDWQITGNLTANLRADRRGQGQGRVYTIVVECSDASENKTRRSVLVPVPHNEAGNVRK